MKCERLERRRTLRKDRTMLVEVDPRRCRHDIPSRIYLVNALRIAGWTEHSPGYSVNRLRLGCVFRSPPAVSIGNERLEIAA